MDMGGKRRWKKDFMCMGRYDSVPNVWGVVRCIGFEAPFTETSRIMEICNKTTDATAGNKRKLGG